MNDPIKYGDNERSRLSGLGSRGNWFSRMSSKRCNVMCGKRNTRTVIMSGY